MILLVQGKKFFSMLSISLLFLFMIACTPNEEVWTGKDHNPIQIACTDACQTLIFPTRITCQYNRCKHKYRKIKFSAYRLTTEDKAKIREFVSTNRGRRVFVSACKTNANDLELNDLRIKAVKAEIRRLGYTPVRIKATLPQDLKTKDCVNLVRGKLHLVVNNCPNNRVTPSVQNIGTSFGCTTNYNLAMMIANPWDLLDLRGDNGTEGSRVALGEEKYREGKVSKLNMESSS